MDNHVRHKLSQKALDDLKAIVVKELGTKAQCLLDGDITNLGIRFLKLTAVVLKRDVKR